MSKRPSCARDLKARIRHLIVDEYQDVNPVQEAVIATLHALGASVCVVGDDDQTLYQWRGSDVDNILSFAARYAGVTQVQLEENFRSSEGVVAVASQFIKQVVRRLPKEMRATTAQDFAAGDIVALPFGTPEEEADYIAQTCKALRGVSVREGDGARGISWSDMAVLLRSVRRDGATITDALAAAGVPYVITGMDNLFAKPEAEAARQLFYFLARRIDAKSLTAAWENADLGIGKQALATAIANATEARDGMAKADVGQFQVYNLQRQFVAFLEATRLREEQVPGERGEVVFYNLGKFSQAISDFESIHFHSKPVDKYDSFAKFLEFQADDAYPEGWQDSDYVTPDAVQIMTVHQAKGLQWPAVFVPQLVRNRFPNRGGGGRSPWHLLPAEAFENAQRYKCGMDDERRLFYVAMTRAQKFLHLTWAPSPGNKQAQAPSDFFTEVLASKYVKRRRQDYAGRERLVLDQNDFVATNGPEIGARATASAPDSTSQVSNCLAVPAELSVADLRLEWRRLFRADPPRLSRDIMMRAIAYRLQEIAHGGASKVTQRRLMTLTAEFETGGTIFEREGAPSRRRSPATLANAL